MKKPVFDPGDRIHHQYHGIGHVDYQTETYVVIRLISGRSIQVSPYTIETYPTEKEIAARALKIRQERKY